MYIDKELTELHSIQDANFTGILQNATTFTHTRKRYLQLFDYWIFFLCLLWLK